MGEVRGHAPGIPIVLVSPALTYSLVSFATSVGATLVAGPNPAGVLHQLAPPPTSPEPSRDNAFVATVVATYQLPPREQQVLALRVAGFGNSEIATQLDVSTNTVRTYIYRMRRRFGGRSVKSLIAEHRGRARRATKT